MVLVTFPVVELAAHFFGFTVRILEFQPRRRGNFAKCIGGLSLIGLPLCVWAAIAEGWVWVLPAAMFLSLVAVCGYILEEIEEQESVLLVESANEDDWREPNVVYMDEARQIEQLYH